jgi:hypothetical protein
VNGEVWNNTDKYLRLIRVSVKFYNDQGELVDTSSSGYPYFDLAPGSKSCFALREYFGDADWDYYAFDPLSYWTDGIPHPSVTAINTNGYPSPSFGSYQILGEIRNDSSITVNYAKVQGTLYDVDGTVLDCWWQYANIPTLEPGQTSAFELLFGYRDAGYADVLSYRVGVEADD